MGIESPGGPEHPGNGDEPIEINEINDGPTRDPLTDGPWHYEMGNPRERYAGAINDIRFLAEYTPGRQVRRTADYRIGLPNGTDVLMRFQSAENAKLIAPPNAAMKYGPQVTHSVEWYFNNSEDPNKSVQALELAFFDDGMVSAYSKVRGSWIIPAGDENFMDLTFKELGEPYNDEQRIVNEVERDMLKQAHQFRFLADQAAGLVTWSARQCVPVMPAHVADKIGYIGDTVDDEVSPAALTLQVVEACSSRTEIKQFEVNLGRPRIVSGLVTTEDGVEVSIQGYSRLPFHPEPVMGSAKGFDFRGDEVQYLHDPDVAAKHLGIAAKKIRGQLDRQDQNWPRL